MLTADRLREVLDYDPESGVFTWKKVARSKILPGSEAGYANGDGYVLIGIDSRLYRAHRLAWLFVYGDFPDGEIDHINCVKTDNRIANLRSVSRRTNAENIQTARKGSASGILGVRPYRDKWRAEIRINGKQKQLGTFESPADAYAAYVDAKRARHKGNML